MLFTEGRRFSWKSVSFEDVNRSWIFFNDFLWDADSKSISASVIIWKIRYVFYLLSIPDLFIYYLLLKFDKNVLEPYTHQFTDFIAWHSYLIAKYKKIVAIISSVDSVVKQIAWNSYIFISFAFLVHENTNLNDWVSELINI